MTKDTGREELISQLEDKLELSLPSDFIGGFENSVNDPPSSSLAGDKCCLGLVELNGTVTRTFFDESDPRYFTSKAPWKASITQTLTTVCNENYHCDSPECENFVKDFNYRNFDQFTDYGNGGQALIPSFSPTPRDTRKGVYIGEYRFKISGEYQPSATPDASVPAAFRGDVGGTQEYSFSYGRLKKLGCCTPPCDDRVKESKHDLEGEATTIGSDTRSSIVGSTMATPVGVIPPEPTGFASTPSGFHQEPGMREIGKAIADELGLDSEGPGDLTGQFISCCTRGDS